jgi:hypothetical protein
LGIGRVGYWAIWVLGELVLGDLGVGRLVVGRLVVGRLVCFIVLGDLLLGDLSLGDLSAGELPLYREFTSRYLHTCTVCILTPNGEHLPLRSTLEAKPNPL